MDVLFCSRCSYPLRIAADELLPDDCPSCQGGTWADIEWLTEAEWDLQKEEDGQTGYDDLPAYDDELEPIQTDEDGEPLGQTVIKFAGFWPKWSAPRSGSLED
jgi:hypothetical protein